MGFDRDRLTRRNFLPGTEHVDLILVPIGGVGNAARDLGIAVRDQADQPVFVGDADPATLAVITVADATAVVLRLVLQGAIAKFGQGAIEHAERALMEDKELFAMGQIATGCERVREQCHRLIGIVDDPLVDREHEILVDRNPALEHETGAIIPAQAHR